ncbi:DUF3080 family protein [Paraglaciecola sp.]|uniref:DUF3080 family protein n=1 Tax=Paraglaciecola sp. TaxID=1920173 RepID=UPI0032671107
MLLACNRADTIDDHLYEYAKRMANILEAEPQQLLQVSLPPYPKITSLQQNIPTTTIKLTDFYGLKHCELYSLVAQRNTVLGRIQLPSTRYMYEAELINALQACLIETTDPQLQSKLTDWLTLKEKQRPKVWANLIQTSHEIKHSLATNTGFIYGTPSDGLNETKTAVDYLIKLSTNNHSANAKLESQLKQLLDSPLPARMWHTQLLIGIQLDQLTSWLQNQASQLQCKSGKKNEKLDYLTNVFRLFFIEKIQPIAGQLNHYHYQLTPTFEELVNHPHLSPSFKQYIHTQHTLGFDEYSNAMTEHLRFWQELFKNCNISPQQI